MKTHFVGIAMTALLLAACSDQGASVDDAAASVSNEAAGDGAPARVAATETTAEVVQRLFESSDLNSSGFLTREEAVVFMELSLISQDTNEDRQLSLEEFLSWDVGFLAIADAKGVTDAYQTAKTDLFRAWDSNGDGQLVLAELDAGIGGDFAAAPRQDENRMTAAEFAEVRFVKVLAGAAG